MLDLDLETIAGEIDRAGHGHKSAIVQRYAQKLGVHKTTIYRGLRKKFGIKKNVSREPEIEQKLINHIAALKIKSSKLGLGKRELSTENCIEFLRDKDISGAERLTKSTVNRRLQKVGFRVPEPKVRIEPDYVNQEAQLDFSRSKYFQIFRYDPVREDYLLKVHGKELHYKKGDRRLRTWICQVKESKSRLRVARAYAATSEDGFIGLETLHWLWNRPEDSHAMRHLFDMLKTDQGAFSKRKEVRAAMEALNIDMRRSMPGNHDSQGKVESGFRSIWNEFELKWATKLGEGALVYLHEYNEMLHDFLSTADAQKEHPTISDTREAVYRRGILQHQPREIDVDVLQIACRVEYRTVDDSLMISLPDGKYEAPHYASGKRIRIYKNMLGELMGELEEEHRRVFVIKPYRYRSIDDFSGRTHQTYRQEIEQRLINNNKPEKEDRSRRLFLPARPEKVTPNSPFVTTDIAPEFSSVYQAKVYIGEQLRAFGQTYADYAEVFDPLLAEDLTKLSIDSVLDAVKETNMRIAL